MELKTLHNFQIRNSHAWQIMFLVTLGVVLFALIWNFPVPASDWGYFWSAAQKPWSPFEIPGYFNPPWVAGFLAPLGMLSFSLSLVVNRSVILVTTLFLVRKSGGGPGAMLMALTSAPFALLFSTSNIDWLPMLAMLLPFEAGLPFLLSKPQGTFGLFFVWWKQSPWERRGHLVMISILILFISLLIWGNWPLQWMKATQAIHGTPWNISRCLWPRGIWLGLILLWFAWRSEDELYALTASIFLTPYLAFYSLTQVTAVLIGRNRVMGGLVWGSLWILHLVLRREAMGL